MSDPLNDPAAIIYGFPVACYIAAERTKHRDCRQRVTCLPLDDPRRTRDMARFVVTDADQ